MYLFSLAQLSVEICLTLDELLVFICACVYMHTCACGHGLVPIGEHSGLGKLRQVSGFLSSSAGLNWRSIFMFFGEPVLWQCSLLAHVYFYVVTSLGLKLLESYCVFAIDDLVGSEGSIDLFCQRHLMMCDLSDAI
jgi:hypothetical protein